MARAGALTSAMRRALCRLLLPLAALDGAAAVDFSREIRPILSENCFFCHGPDDKKREGGLRLDDETEAKRNRDGVTAVVPGDPERSALIQRIVTQDPDEVMPPPKQHKTIPPAQVALLRQWIREGAKWGRHWSYEKVARPKVPAGGHPVDAFLNERLRREGLTANAPADARTLLRRLALDLTGLPPTLEELQRLAPPGAASPAAIEAMADHYLARPAFGEHWARLWLDLARYADSAGYPSDPGREIWAYRDWVIQALNRNQPFDQFTIEQLAGDLLPRPTDAQLIATAFHRNTMTQNEGGTSDEEFRNAAVVDRVNTTFAVWMGTTMACAQCHTHKYDPITLKEYFQFYAFLNQTADADKKDESPLHRFDTPELKAQRRRLQQEIGALERRFGQPEPAWLAGQAAWEAGLARPLAWNTPAPAQVTLQSRQAARTTGDGWVISPAPQARETHTVVAPLTGSQLTALRIDTAPEPGFGNFVLTGVKAEIVPPADQPAPQARHVRIELPGANKLLQLAEVQVFRGADNLALRGSATQSSTYTGATAARAIDGRTDGEYAKGSVAHTAEGGRDPWWELDLKRPQALERVVVWNRTDGDTGKRLEGFRVVLLDAERREVWKSGATPAPAAQQAFALTGPVPVQFTVALADHEQDGFPAASVLRPYQAKKNPGWAVAGASDRPHALTLLAAAPVALPAGAQLRVTLEQQSEHARHTLGKFRVSHTGDARAATIVKLPAPVVTAAVKPAATRSPAEQQVLTQHYVREVAPAAAAERRRLAAAKRELTALQPVTVPILQELAAKDRRVTRVQLRGNWQDLGETVEAATPAAFPPLPAGAPRDRLTMAHWLVSRDNPLTARVTVNRFWEALFGTGIVRTSEEFGSQGELPFHPELLDWLAAEFMDSGWDVKRLLKLLVMSEAYRRDSRSTPELNERDPDNRLLARGPRFRPAGELLRDQALAVSGLLSPRMFGKPVRPLRPNLGLNTAFGGNNDWATSPGEDRHRRSVYTEMRRNSPYPSFSTFDAPNREVCTLRRGRTNTPLQAFVTLNDPVFIETHQALARRLLREAPTTDARLRRLFLLCLAREPGDREAAALARLHADSLQAYRADAAAAARMATDPLGAAPAGSDLAELAAWTVVANVVTNLDEFVMRR